ncbi:AraC family transcriptional regulator [Paenibacillus cisolokensis]|uniref:AraC family transcriptional regulator n=1 Tax=Paenibacillus cisolokensis TaxID=1658519 RepID=UPI003D2CD38B
MTSSSDSGRISLFDPMGQQEPFDFGYHVDSPMTGGQFHSHSLYEIYYFHEGRCTYLIGDSIFVLKPGDLLLMNGLTLHCPKVEPGTPYIRSIIHFDPAWVCRDMPESLRSALLEPFASLLNYRMTLEGARKAEFESMLAGMHRLGLSKNRFVRERMALRLQEMMYMISDWCQGAVQDQEAVSDKERHVQHVISFVEQNYMYDLTLDQIARKAHVTKHYLSSLFKEITGTSVFKYVYNRRINQAKILLRLNPDLSITEVSQAAGFKHLAHFSRMFKEMVGATPEHYRKSGVDIH